MVILTFYKGIYQYGKRSKKNRPVWEVPAPRLVSDELWQAAQEALARNRITAKNTPRHYLLTSLIKCGECGKTFCCALGRGQELWYRCNGKMTSRYNAENRCQSRSIKGSEIENIIWQDIERWLNDSGDLIKELEDERELDNSRLADEQERIKLEANLEGLEKQRKVYLRQSAQELIEETELREFLSELAEKKSVIEKRLDELKPQDQPEEDILSADLLEEERKRVKRAFQKKRSMK